MHWTEWQLCLSELDGVQAQVLLSFESMFDYINHPISHFEYITEEFSYGVLS